MLNDATLSGLHASSAWHHLHFCHSHRLLSCIPSPLPLTISCLCAGFQTDVAGASLVLMVTLPSESSISKLSLGYLASYEGMGWAQVECLGACSCPVLQIDANSTARASQEHFATVDIERQNEGDGCLLKVATLYRSSATNDGHKFKVSSVAWTHDGTASEADVVQPTQQNSAVAQADIKHAITEPQRVVTLGDI